MTAARTPSGVGDPRRDDRRARVRPEDFRISETGAGVTWAGEPRPGLPLLHWPGGAICEPAWVWFAHSVTIGRLVPSSLSVEAYALRDWFAFQWRRGVPWHGATDALLREWRADRSGIDAAIPRSGRAKPPSKRQVERCIAIVFAFYAGLPEAMGAGARDEQAGPFARGARARGSPIKSRIVVTETPYGRVERLSWRWAGRVPRRTLRRPTPGAADVARLLAHLRSRAARVPTQRPCRSAPRSAAAVAGRDWMVARCMAEAGLRAAEVAMLDIAALARALGAVGACGLEAACGTDAGDAGREAILARLDALAAAGSRDIEVEITLKGATRGAPFPLGLVRELCAVWLFAGRPAFSGAGGGATTAVFPSLKTGMALSAGSVSDIVQDAFRTIGIASSGHRLRAHFAEELAITLLRERMALNGDRLDEGVEAWVLRRVADALGHASVSTTVTHYVDRAVMRLGRDRANAP